MVLSHGNSAPPFTQVLNTAFLCLSALFAQAARKVQPSKYDSQLPTDSTRSFLQSRNPFCGQMIRKRRHPSGSTIQFWSIGGEERSTWAALRITQAGTVRQLRPGILTEFIQRQNEMCTLQQARVGELATRDKIIITSHHAH